MANDDKMMHKWIGWNDMMGGAGHVDGYTQYAVGSIAFQAVP